jgi:hypothetical protein
VGGLTVGLTNFTRSAESFDYDYSTVPFGTTTPSQAPNYRPGIDPIRKATRFSFAPTLYTTLRPFDVISIVPSVKYNEYYYNFGNAIPSLSRGYLLLQTEVSTQFEHIYEYPNDLAIPKVKHLIRPTLTYSMIPYIHADTQHPFLQQIARAQTQGITGYNFDDYDIVPYDYNPAGSLYFVPQGHSLAYGVSTQWIRRLGGLEVEAPSYRTTVELTAGQAINFLQMRYKDTGGHPFTRFYSTLDLKFDKLQSASTYYYYPDAPASATSRHVLLSSLTYIFERGVHQQVLTYDRSVTLGYSYSQLSGSTSNLTGVLNFSLSDYLLPYGTISYAMDTATLLGGTAGVKLQSPSRCWMFGTSLGYLPTTGNTVMFDLSLNLTGTGFGGMTEAANTMGVDLPNKQ